MASKKEYVCNKCGYKSAKWLGKCPECNSWNSFEEQVVAPTPSASSQFQHKTTMAESGQTSRPQELSTLLENLDTREESKKYEFSTELLNKFWGGGLTSGSLTLLAGEPGNGKSTLSLQLLRALSQKNATAKMLYITAEESVFELARRSRRLGIPKHISVLQSNNYEHIEQIIESSRPHIVIIDSIQTIFSSYIPSSPGSIAQVSKLASQFLAISKSLNISIFLIGHVTKEGQIAGPKTLEHLVDSVLVLETSDNSLYRTLSFSKHRFGTTDSMLLMKMEETGLEIVTDPSLALLENLETGVGVVYSLALDKDLPLVVEIQALVSIQNSPNNYGRREAIGMPVSKLNTILAIAEKYLRLNFRPHDVYIQLVGLPKNSYDDSLDIAVLLAVLSSLFNKQVELLLTTKKSGSSKNRFDQQLNSSSEFEGDLVPSIEVGENAVDSSGTDKKKVQKAAQKMLFAGRLTLSGNIRPATYLEKRKATAKKLGFQLNPGVDSGLLADVLRLYGGSPG